MREDLTYIWDEKHQTWILSPMDVLTHVLPAQFAIFVLYLGGGLAIYVILGTLIQWLKQIMVWLISR